MGGVAEHRHPGTRSQRCPHRQPEQTAQYLRGVTVGDQGGELGGPAVEFLDDPGEHDDRDQFLFVINVFMAGIATVR